MKMKKILVGALCSAKHWSTKGTTIVASSLAQRHNEGDRAGRRPGRGREAEMRPDQQTRPGQAAGLPYLSPRGASKPSPHQSPKDYNREREKKKKISCGFLNRGRDRGNGALILKTCFSLPHTQTRDTMMKSTYFSDIPRLRCTRLESS